MRLNPLFAAPLLIIAILFYPSLSYAQPTLDPSPYTLSLVGDSAIVGLALTVGLPGVFLGEETTPTEEELGQLSRSDVPAFDRFATRKWNPAASDASDILGYVGFGLPLTAIAFHYEDAPTLLTLYAETYLWTLAGISFSKGFVGRHRPLAYNNQVPLEERLKAENDSFFSGHAAEISALSILTAKFWMDYHPDADWMPLVWSGAAITLGVGAWLRVEAGQHFPSDVLIGAVWGGVAGYAIPELHKQWGETGTAWTFMPMLGQGNVGLRVGHPL